MVTGLGQQVSRARDMGSYRLGELLGRGGPGDVSPAPDSSEDMAAATGGRL